MKANKQRALLQDKIPDTKSPNHVHRTPRQNAPSPDSPAPTVALLPTDGRLTPRDIIQLQNTRGNQAVARLIAQRKAKDLSVQRLPDQLEGAMGSMFDVNLADVGIHTDAQADKVARDSQTDATTIGSDIYFQQGAYRPGTADGNALIAREVSHIQRAKMTGSPNHGSSATASAADKNDAQSVAGIVQDMGSNPANVLKPANGPDKKPSKAQRHILQREGEEYGGSRTAGIVTSKVLQSLAGTLLGPVGLIWRGPLIQKAWGETWGADMPTRAGKKDDRKRYGEGSLAFLMRIFATASEVLKEVAIWLGFGTLIAAIVAAATHGVAAPVFAGLAIASAVTLGLHAVLRSILSVFNAYRYFRTKNQIAFMEGVGGDASGDRAKLPFIKHQLANDFGEGLGAAIGAILSGFAGGGLGSMGGDIATASGHSATTDITGRLIGTTAGMAAGLPTSAGTAFIKEGAKEYAKPSAKKEHGKWGMLKNFSGGFMKDGKSDMAPALTPIKDGAWSGLVSMTDYIRGRSTNNVGDQNADSQEAADQRQTISGVSGKVDSATKDMTKTGDALKDTGTKAEANKDAILDQVNPKDKSDAKSISKEVKKGLSEKDPADQASSSQDQGISGTIDKDMQAMDKTDDLSTVQTKRAVQRKGGVGDWFAAKLSGIKSGISRLNNKIIVAAMKYAMKLGKIDADRTQIMTAMANEKTFTSSAADEEAVNDTLFADDAGQAAELDDKVKMFAAMDQGQ